MERLTKKPGQFRAQCRKGAWVPLDEILRLPREEQPDTLTTRWDKALRCEIGILPCRLDTTDRAEYLAHMADAHGKKPRGPRQLKLGTGMWNGPRLTAEGAPLKPSTKEIAGRVETCASCGLVAEVDGRAANVMWWDEHERMCVGQAVA